MEDKKEVDGASGVVMADPVAAAPLPHKDVQQGSPATIINQASGQGLPKNPKLEDASHAYQHIPQQQMYSQQHPGQPQVAYQQQQPPPGHGGAGPPSQLHPHIQATPGQPMGMAPVPMGVIPSHGPPQPHQYVQGPGTQRHPHAMVQGSGGPAPYGQGQRAQDHQMMIQAHRAQQRVNGNDFEDEDFDDEDGDSPGAKRRKLSHNSQMLQQQQQQQQQKSSKHQIHPQPVVSSWLLENYEPAEGVSLPRSLLYAHYQDFCSDTAMEPVNPASFGKHIRSVFLGLKTRRLGTRGHSKYHYYGIKVRDSSPLREYYLTHDEDGMDEGAGGPGGSTVVKEEDAAEINHPKPILRAEQAVLPPFPSFDLEAEAEPFLKSYRVFSERMLVAVHRQQFTEVESLLEFFRTLPPPARVLVKKSDVIKALIECDQIVYDTILEYLLSNVLDPLPTNLTQAIRHFAKHLGPWLVDALKDLPEEFQKAKDEAAREFAQCLRRRTSLNHLAQAARQVLVKETQMQQMLTDWLNVDFPGIYDQAQWICNCDSNKLEQLRGEFTQRLKERCTLEQWVQWLKVLVDSHLDSSTPEKLAASSRHFLLKWSFFSTLVIRDLTLRSALSFGSFHLMRLLYDEYVVYHLEKSSQRKSSAISAEQIRSDDKTADVGSTKSDEVTEVKSDVVGAGLSGTGVAAAVAGVGDENGAVVRTSDPKVTDTETTTGN